jgi:hypothetical protein
MIGPGVIWILEYLIGFGTNYTIFRNAEIFKNYFPKDQNLVKENEESFGYLKIFLFPKWNLQN